MLSFHWTIQFFKAAFRVSFYTIWFYSLAVWFSPFPNTKSNALDFRPVSLVFTVKHDIQELAMSSQEILLPAWNFCFSQGPELLNNQLAGIPITPNHYGTHELKEEVLSSVRAQDLHTSGFDLSNKEDIGNFLENAQLVVDAVFTRDWYPLSVDIVCQFRIERMSRKPHSNRQWGGQRKIAHQSSRILKIQLTTCVAVEESVWNKNWKYSWLSLEECVSIKILC